MQRISAEDIKPGMLIHDEHGPETFVVTAVNVAEHSTQVAGNAFRPWSGSATGFIVMDIMSMFINGDTGLWRLDD